MENFFTLSDGGYICKLCWGKTSFIGQKMHKSISCLLSSNADFLYDIFVVLWLIWSKIWDTAFMHLWKFTDD